MGARLGHTEERHGARHVQAYRLTKDTLGIGRSLDGTTRLTTASSDDGPGQRWRLQPQDGGTYGLTTEALGPCYAIDVTNDGTYTPVFVPAADFTGQMWHVEPPASPGTGRGPDPAAVRPAAPLAQTEGHADFTVHLVPRGVLRAVVIFADFDDPPGEVDPAEIGSGVHGSGAATQLFHEQSHGVLELEVTVRSDLGWRWLPNSSTAYDFGDGEKQRQFMTDAAALIGADELRFDDYDLVLAVTAYTRNVSLSPAYLHVPGDGAPSASGEILHGVSDAKIDWKALSQRIGHAGRFARLHGSERAMARLERAPVQNHIQKGRFSVREPASGLGSGGGI